MELCPDCVIGYVCDFAFSAAKAASFNKPINRTENTSAKLEDFAGIRTVRRRRLSNRYALKKNKYMPYNEEAIIDLFQNLKKEDLALANLAPREKKLYELISAIITEGIEDGIKIIMSKMMHLQMAKRCLPNANESAVITLDNPKSAALIFDRVWTPFIKDVPGDVGFFGNTNLEIDIWSCQRIQDIAQGFVSNKDLSQKITTNSRFMIDLISTGEMLNSVDVSSNKKFNPEFPYFTLFHRISAVLNSRYNCNIQALLPNEVDFQKKYSVGDKRFLYTALKDLAIPDEEKLSWEQVSELRKDKESKKKAQKIGPLGR